MINRSFSTKISRNGNNKDYLRDSESQWPVQME